jgi:hypothetical protein
LGAGCLGSGVQAHDSHQRFLHLQTVHTVLMYTLKYHITTKIHLNFCGRDVRAFPSVHHSFLTKIDIYLTIY